MSKKPTYINKLNSPTHDKILVLGSGPSHNSNSDKILSLKEEGFITIEANNADADYSVYIDDRYYQKNKTLSRKMIIGPKVNYNKDVLLYNKISLLNYKKRITKFNNISINANGEIGHMVGNCGFAALVTAYFFSPKIIYLSGFDGPKKDGSIEHFNGTTTKLRKSDIYKLNRNKKFLYKIIEFLIEQGIIVTAFADDRLWGIDRSVLTGRID